VGVATIQSTANLEAADLGLVARTDPLDACVRLQHLSPKL
jgi:hypothetical protein